MLRLLLAISACVFVFAVADTAHASFAQSYEAELEAAIEYHFHGYEEDVAHYVVNCESGYGADIYNEYSAAYGPWQFLPSTSYAMGFDHGLMADPWYSTYAAAEYVDVAGWTPWACAA